MKLVEVHQSIINKQAFDMTTTGMPMYDNMMQNRTYFRQEKGKRFTLYKDSWSPEKYLQRAAQGFESTVQRLQDTRDQRLIDKYAKQMQSGEKFPILVLDYSHRFTQEGIHRAFAAIKAGVDIVPVLTVYSA